MKYPTIFLVFIALVTGCASDNTSRSDTESQNSVIYIDPGKVADVTTGPYLLPYGMAKSMWEPSYLNDGTTDELAREVFAHTTFLEIWKQDSNRRTTTQPALDAMVHILDAGYLREAIWIKHQNLFTYQPAGLDLLGFKQWVDENPDLLIQPDAKLIVDVVPSQSKPEVIPPTSSGRTLGGTPDEVKPAVINNF